MKLTQHLTNQALTINLEVLISPISHVLGTLGAVKYIPLPNVQIYSNWVGISIHYLMENSCSHYMTQHDLKHYSCLSCPNILHRNSMKPRHFTHVTVILVYKKIKACKGNSGTMQPAQHVVEGDSDIKHTGKVSL